ncbi:MAG: hypothetical protein ACOH5I_18850 [Oligoflexus sp.]
MPTDGENTNHPQKDGGSSDNDQEAARLNDLDDGGASEVPEEPELNPIVEQVSEENSPERTDKLQEDQVSDTYPDDNPNLAEEQIEDNWYEEEPVAEEYVELPAVPTQDWVELDDHQARYVGDWVFSRAVNTFTGSGYHHSNHDGKNKKAFFSLANRIEVSGYYHIYGFWTAHSNRASNTRFTIKSLDSSAGVLKKLTKHHEVNQKTSKREDNYLGTYYFTANQGLTAAELQ